MDLILTPISIFPFVKLTNLKLIIHLMVFFKNFSGESCQRCSLYYVFDTYNNLKFVSDLLADDTTTTLRAGAFPNEIAQPVESLGHCSHVAGEDGNTHQPMVYCSTPLDEVESDISADVPPCRSSVLEFSAVDEATDEQSHSDGTDKRTSAIFVHFDSRIYGAEKVKSAK